MSENTIVKSEKGFVPTLLLALFLGGLGVHRFFVGKIGTGIKTFLEFIGGFFEFRDTSAQSPCQFWEFFRPDHDQGYRQKEEKLWHADSEHLVILLW